VWDLHDIRVAAFVDEPFVIVQTCNALEFRVRAAFLHLMPPEVGAVAEVDCAVAVVRHCWVREGVGCSGGSRSERLWCEECL
jgi:hypothetical protein